LLPVGRALSRLLFRPVSGLRPRRKPPPASTPDPSQACAVPDLQFGDFTPQRKLHEGEQGIAWLGNDRLLHRQVLILEHPPGRPRLGEERRKLDSLTRLRWIGTSGSEERAWDAFDLPALPPSLWAALPGRRKRPWREARQVVGHLAAELDAAWRDGTLPPVLSLSQVLVGRDTKVMLLDVPLEGEGASAESFPADSRGIRSFLRVLVAALATGRTPSGVEAERDRTLVRLPVKDHRLVRNLWDPSVNLRPLLAPMARDLLIDTAGNSELTAGTRLKHLLAVGLVFAPFASGVAESRVQSTSNFGSAELSTMVFQVFLSILLFAMSGAIFRGGAVLRLDGVEVALLDGTPASRTRCLLRSLPIGIAAGVVSGLASGGAETRGWLVVALVLLFAALGQTVAHPSRSLGDLVARTYLRPK